MFTVALFTVAQTGRQHNCPSTDECVKDYGLYTMGYYSAVKENEILPFAATQMKWDAFIMSEVSQTEKKKYIYGTINMWNLKNDLIYKTGTDSVTQKTNLCLPNRKVREKG